MENKDKKKVAPIIIGIMIVLVLIMYIAAVMVISIPVFVKIIAGIVLMALIFTMVSVVMERLNEIEEGEEDDLDNY